MEYTCMIYNIYTFQYEANQFLYGPGKGHQQYLGTNYLLFLARFLNSIEVPLNEKVWLKNWYYSYPPPFVLSPKKHGEQ